MAQKLLVQKELESKEMLHREEIKQWQTETEKLLEERDRQLEKEKKARHWEKEKLQQGIQQREAQVNALEQKLSQQRTKAELQREAFLNEPICNKINDSIRNLYITARDGASQNVILSDRDKAELKEAVLKHYENFENVLMSMYPRMNKEDLLLCQLYLLGLDERQIAVLRCKTYSAIKKHASKLKGLLRIEESLSDFVMKTMSYQQPK